jgi:NTE family protein
MPKSMTQLRRSFATSLLLLFALMNLASSAQAQAGGSTPVVPPPAETQGAGQLKVTLVQPPSGRPSGTSNIDTSQASLDSAPAVISSLPPTVPAGRPIIGLVLEGGGAMGIAHIGVLRWLEENHIPIDRLSGTSMGSLVGALYASGVSVNEIEAIATGEILTSIFILQEPYTDLSFRRRQDRRDLPQAIQLGLKGGPSLRNSLLTDRALNAFLRDHFASYNSASVDFDRLPIPFRCVATDLTSMKPLIFRGGPLPSAVRASISIPGVFPPVDYHKHFLVDGAIMDNLPIDVARRDLHSSVIIAVHLPNTPFSESDVSSVVGVFASAFSAGTARNVEESLKLADVLVLPGTDKFTTLDYAKASQLIAAGYASAEEQRARLAPYALKDADWNAYLAARKSRIGSKPGLFDALHVAVSSAVEGYAGAEHEVAVELAPMKQQAIDSAQLSKHLENVQSNGSYEATFETFSNAAPSLATSALSDSGPNANPDTGVLVRLNPVRNGPPFLLFGVDLSAMSSNVTRTDYDFRLIDQNLGGFGSELRADFRLGFLTQAYVEYYRLLNLSGWYIQPHIGILRQPVYQWINQDRVSEWFEQQAGGGLDIGRTFNRNLQTSLEYRNQGVRWDLTSGNTSERNVSGTAQTAVAHFVYDSTESGTLTPRGGRFDLSAGAIFNSVKSPNAPLVRMRVGRSFTSFQKNLFVVSAELDSYFRRNITNPLRFTLGGPLRLSASSIDEYRATDFYLARLGYLRKLAALPTGLGHGLYLTTAYEAGEVWTPKRPAFLRMDVFSGLVADTPLGVITFGGSVGDAGHRKLLLTFGRLF